MNIEDGGPAFPCEQHETQDNTWNQTFETGMSLRDYFAAKAMQGLMARVGPHNADAIAHDAYMVADAMLEARNKA